MGVILDTPQIYDLEAAVVTLEQVVPLLIGLLIGLLVSLIVGGLWSARAHPLNFAWLNTHDRVMGWLLMLAMFALGMFVTYVLLRL